MSAGDVPGRVTAIVVVIPARNEEALIGACLSALRRAIDELNSAWHSRIATHPAGATATATRPPAPAPAPAVQIHTVVVVDDSDDRTAAIASSFDFATVLETGGGNVGAARAVGVSHALFCIEAPAETVWVANTDADSEVPPNWLIDQLEQAASSADVVIGTVRPRFADLTTGQIEAWQRMHEPGVANGHVHGANLGLRASVYLAAGGFSDLVEHEDVELVARVRANGARIAASATAEVLTSGRQQGRTPGGYAGYLRSQLESTDSVVR